MFGVQIFSCYNLSAQTDEGQRGEDLGWVVPQDNGLNFSIPAVPTIVRYAVARYQSSAQVFLVVTLVSSSQLEVKGFGKYQSNARILSSFGLTGTLAKSEPEQTGPNCCSLGSGVYLLSAYCPGLTRSSLRTWARERFMAYLNFVPGINLDSMTGEYGYRGGGARPDCALVVVQDRNDGAESALPTTISEGFLEVRGTAVWLFKQPEKQAWQFDLVDVNGKVIHSFNGDYTDSELIDLQEANIPAGLYFGQLRDKTGVKNIRLTKSN